MTWVTQEAEVISQLSKGLTKVKPCAAKGCGSCSLAGGCGQGVLSRWFASRAPNLSLQTSLQLQPGDRVLVGLEASQLNRAALLQFILPLLTLLLAAMLAEFLGITSGFKLLGIALLGLTSGLFLARIFATTSQLKIVSQLNPSTLTVENNNWS